VPLLVIYGRASDMHRSDGSQNVNTEDTNISNHLKFLLSPMDLAGLFSLANLNEEGKIWQVLDIAMSVGESVNEEKVIMITCYPQKNVTVLPTDEA